MDGIIKLLVTSILWSGMSISSEMDVPAYQCNPESARIATRQAPSEAFGVTDTEYCTDNYDPPIGYYHSVDPSSAETLRSTLHAIIHDHRVYNYAAAKGIVVNADEYPADGSKVIDVYKNITFLKTDDQWGREHTWPVSYGFPDETPCNIPYTDCHALRVCDSSYNTSRSNKIFEDCTSGCSKKETIDDPVPGDFLACDGPDGHERANWTDSNSWEVWCGRKGDVARGLLYLDVRYEGGTHGDSGCEEPDLILTNNANLIQESDYNQDNAYMGLLDDLIQWHLDDPVDDCERRRNDTVFDYQHNRNPFVDHPEWVCILYSDSWPCDGLPTYIPTATPYLSPTVTPTPGLSPTPPPSRLDVDLALSHSVFYPGDRFQLIALITNSGPIEYVKLPFVVLLDFHGSYFYHPTWTQSFEYEQVSVSIGSTEKTILDFQWPNENSYGAGVRFYGAFLTNDLTELMSSLGSVSFGWSP